MKQQNKRPPKPKKQGLYSAVLPASSKATGAKSYGKENLADQNKDQILQQSIKHSLDRDQLQGQKQRFKSSNGANRSSSQQDTKRPHLTSTIVVGSGTTLLEHQLKAQRQLYSAMGNATKLQDYSKHDKREPVIQDIEIPSKGKNLLRENMMENSLGSWLQKQPSQAESKYSSTRNKQQLLERHLEAAITGRRVDQPRVVVGDVDTNDVFNNMRFSPQRDKQTTTAQLPLQIRKASKKSKSQTIQGSTLHSQKNAWAKRGMKPQRMMEFLDSSIVNVGVHNESFRINDELVKREEGNERDLTLKILTQTADNINLSQGKSGQRQRPRSMERSKVQMKYLNFHRENVLKSQFRQTKAGPSQPKRCTTALNAHSNRNFEKELNKTQSTSADRIHRLAGTQSPLSKSGVIRNQKELQRQQRKQKKDATQMTKSANEMQASGAISSLILPNHKNDSEKAMLYFKQPAQQNNSTMPGPNDQSQISLVHSNHKLSQQNVKKHKTSISPERAAKIDKFIRENIRREKQVQESRQRELKQREASSVRRKQLLDQKNQHIRQLNKDKTQRRRLKLKENLTISGDEQEPNEMKQLERALLAVSDEVQNIETVSKNFDSRQSQKVFSRGGLRTQQLGQVSSSLKMQLAHLKATDDLNGLHRKSQGMDFINVRREISNELKGSKSRGGVKTLKKDILNGASLMDSAFMLQTSKSQKQEFVPLRSQVNQTSISIHQGFAPSQNDKKATQLTQVKQENMLFKRNQIRKFMREKARLMQTKVDQQKAEEISTFKKVRSNLTKLNNFVQKRFGQIQISGITTPALKVKRQHKKNVTVVYDEKDVIQSTALRQSRHQDRTITPTKGGLFENSDVSLNISGKNHRGQNRSILGQLTQKDFQKLHDTLYEDSRLSSIQTLEERSIKRGGGTAQSALGVCFEKSASQKALRKQLQASPIPEIRNSSKKRPRSALNVSSVNRSIKRKIKSAKRSKSQSGTKKIYLPTQGKLTAKLQVQNQGEGEDHDNPKMTDSTAAKVIQKEVRKFLSSLGFYEARQIEDDIEDGRTSPRLTSRDNSQQINLFIEPIKSRDRSPSRHKQSDSSKRKTRVQYSPDYELIQPSTNKKGDQLRPSPPKQMKSSKIEKLSVDENEIAKIRALKNQSNHSSEEAHSSQKRLRHQKEDADAILDAVKSSAERKRASAEVRNVKQLALLSVKPNKTKQLAPHDYHGSSHGSSQLPGIHSVTTPQSSKIILGIKKSGQGSTSPHQSDINVPSGEKNGDIVSQSSSSLFDRNTFQQFSQKRLSQIMQNNEYHKLIQFKEECLVFRERKERKLINKLLSENQMTPRTYQQRKQKIEKWVSIQREEIEKTKQGFKEEWEKTMQMIDDTQKNVDHMRIKIASAININGADSNSYSQASSRYNNGRPPRSYLIDEAPKSYRSGYQDPKLENNTVDDETSVGVLSARKAGLLNLAEKAGAQTAQGKFDNHSTSKSEIKQQREGRDRSSSDALHVSERHQSMTGGKGRDSDRIIDGNRLKQSTGTAYELDNQSNQDQLPSAAFLNRLEKATYGLLPQNSAEGTLTIEEHSFAEDLLEDNGQSYDLDDDKKGSTLKQIDSSEDTFEDGNFKNRVVQIRGLNQLFAGESNGNSEAVSDHKSEPQMFDPAELSEETSGELKISEMLRKKMELRLQLNYEDENDLIQEPAIITNKLVTAVTKPVPPQSSLQSDEYKLKLVDQITEQLINQMLQESLQVPTRENIDKKSGGRSALQPQPDQDVYIIDSLAMDKEEKKEWIDIRQRHLIEGSLIRADQYVNEMLDVLLQFDISDISENSDFDYEVKPTDNFHIQFLKLLTQPIQRPAIDALTQMQTSELGSYIHFETTLDVSKHPIVPVDLYLDIEKAREESLLIRRRTADQRTLQIWESVHIFNKCIFDAINESLMKFRPYGIVGQPMPWSNKVRRLQTKVEIASVDTERLFQMVKQEIFRWTQVFCGCLPGPVFYFPNPRTGRDEFQEDLLQEVRERRLTSVLTQDTVEHEHHWLNYEFEETQVKVDLSDMILEQLVGELIGFLQQQQQNNAEY